MGNPSKEQLLDQETLQEPSTLDPIETSLDADTPSISNTDNNSDFEKLQAHSEEPGAKPQGLQPDHPDMADEKQDHRATLYFKILSKNKGVRYVQGVTLEETIDSYYKNLDIDLSSMEQLKLKTLSQKIHRSYYSYWRLNANLLMRQLVVLKTRKRRISNKS